MITQHNGQEFDHSTEYTTSGSFIQKSHSSRFHICWDTAIGHHQSSIYKFIHPSIHSSVSDVVRSSWAWLVQTMGYLLLHFGAHKTKKGLSEKTTESESTSRVGPLGVGPLGHCPVPPVRCCATQGVTSGRPACLHCLPLSVLSLVFQLLSCPEAWRALVGIPDPSRASSSALLLLGRRLVLGAFFFFFFVLATISMSAAVAGCTSM